MGRMGDSEVGVERSGVLPAQLQILQWLHGRTPSKMGKIDILMGIQGEATDTNG